MKILVLLVFASIVVSLQGYTTKITTTTLPPEHFEHQLTLNKNSTKEEEEKEKETPIAPTTISADQSEDQLVLNQTIEKYGLPQDYRKLKLPGPELEKDDNKLWHSNQFLAGEVPGEYTLRTRIITAHFSYNGRYERSKIKKTNDSEIVEIVGQFGEHFVRESGGYYIRTIGYTLDENGYRQFLIDLSTAETTTDEFYYETDAVGGPGSNKISISSTALASLIGGNSLG